MRFFFMILKTVIIMVFASSSSLSAYGDWIDFQLDFLPGYRQDDFKWSIAGNATFEENKQYIQDSFLAPTIVGDFQKQVGYIPCRIFKNISYGAMGLTNSKSMFKFPVLVVSFFYAFNLMAIGPLDTRPTHPHKNWQCD